MKGEKESRDRQQGTGRVPLSDVKVSKTPPLRECAELLGARAREAGGQREGTAKPGTGWDGEGLERSGGGGAKALQLNRESVALSSLPGLGDAIGVRSSRTQSCNCKVATTPLHHHPSLSTTSVYPSDLNSLDASYPERKKRFPD